MEPETPVTSVGMLDDLLMPPPPFLLIPQGMRVRVRGVSVSVTVSVWF